MEIVALQFGAFVLAALVVYYLLPKQAQNYWLLLVSYIFCITWAWQFAAVMLLVTSANFLLSHRVNLAEGRRRRWLWLAIGLNGLALIIFRTADFYVPQLLSLLSQSPADAETGALQILVPIGLSYYVLELISYQADVYRGLITPVKDPVDFALYIAYFPKLLAGPIETARSFLPKLAQQRVVDNELLGRSAALIIIGAGRKLIVADTLTAAIPWDVFEAPSNFGAPDLWLWLIVYGFALYNDFAGYTNIVRGVSGLFGIELSPNFAAPYFARNFTELWNRWHITLSQWLREYIFFPLSRALLRRKPGRFHPLNITIPPLATMLVSGLWHGFSVHMLLWGGLHGVYLIGDRLASIRGPIVPVQKRPLWRQIVGAMIVFILVMLAWVTFRLEVPLAIEFWRTLFTWGNWGIRYRRIILVVPLITLVLILDWLQQREQDELFILRWPRPVQAAVYSVTIFLVVLLIQPSDGEPFVYQGF
jgi:alginate O-acetyltransferase complex protein AlgI